jgi:hypothetical protein
MDIYKLFVICYRVCRVVVVVIVVGPVNEAVNGNGNTSPSSTSIVVLCFQPSIWISNNVLYRTVLYCTVQ